MSTQSDSGIEFLLQPEENQQHFRLLELPADLLQIITSANAPILQLKSSDNATGSNNVALCTPDQTFELRQVSTSNSVFLTEPAPSPLDPDHGLPQPRLQAIAQLNSTLEVLSSARQSAVPYIAAAVPAYTSTGHQALSSRITKSQLFANIPLSEAECESGWRELACFEVGDDKHCVLPTANVKLKVWQAVLGSATAAGIDLTQPFDLDGIVDEESDWPIELLRAVLGSMSGVASTSDSLTLDPALCTKVVGKALLKNLADDARGPVSLTSFEGQWRDLVPENWRGNAALGLLDGHYHLSGDGQEVAYVAQSSTSPSAANGSRANEAKSTLGAKRKWHEKFRAAKKTS